MLRGVHFDFDKYNIRPGDAAVLDEAASTLKAHPDLNVDVNGYTLMRLGARSTTSGYQRGAAMRWSTTSDSKAFRRAG